MKHKKPFLLFQSENRGLFHIAYCCEVLQIQFLRPAPEDLLRQRGDHPPDPPGIKHATGTFQAVADGFPAVREECPYYISIPLPVIDGKDRVLSGNYFHNR